MVSAEAKGLLTSGGSILAHITDKEESISDDSLSSGDGTRFKNRTGIFHLDFPPTQKISKGKSKISTSKTHPSQIPSVSREITESDTDSDIDIRQSGVVAKNILVRLYLQMMITVFLQKKQYRGAAKNKQVFIM